MKELSSPFYSFSAMSIEGVSVEMSTYQDKLVLIVNTASECGFTDQYQGLESLYRKYKDEGLVILGFPCNQFGRQEPGDEAAIIEGCLMEYDITFPMFAKVNVNGKAAHPLFKYLKKELSSMLGGRIKWNFTKFLVDKNGRPLKRYASSVTPKKIENDIRDSLLNDK